MFISTFGLHEPHQGWSFDWIFRTDVFRRGGYQNEWVLQKKLLRTVGLQSSLVCRLDTERFTLNLLLERKGAPVFNQQILETRPDEIIFAHRFKEVVVEGQAIVVKDKYGDALFSVDATALG